MRVLHLTLKKKWFDMIASGQKKEEYRDATSFILPRIFKLSRPFVHSNASIRYNTVTEAFWYCVGFKGCRSKALHLLFRKGAECRTYDAVTFQHGYKKNADRVTIQFKGISYGTGKPEWGAEPSKKYFIINLGAIISPHQPITIK